VHRACARIHPDAAFSSDDFVFKDLDDDPLVLGSHSSVPVNIPYLHVECIAALMMASGYAAHDPVVDRRPMPGGDVNGFRIIALCKKKKFRC
jgi:hypothetical protein